MSVSSAAFILYYVCHRHTPPSISTVLTVAVTFPNCTKPCRHTHNKPTKPPPPTRLTRWRCTRPRYCASTASRVGMRHTPPANCGPNQLPASNCCSCCAVAAAAGPLPLLTRPRASSCSTTGTPSADSWVSVSKWWKPWASARSKAWSVFSGAALLSPLWAMMTKLLLGGGDGGCG